MNSLSSSSSTFEYPYPSMLNVANFVSIKLSNSNYKLWEAQMSCLIESQDLLGFIDVKTPLPPSSQYVLWRRSDQLLKGWILGSLNEDVLATVVGLETARDVWTALRHMFGSCLDPEETNGTAEEGVDQRRYLSLYEAALKGDWQAAQVFLLENPNANGAPITPDSQTALHVAVQTGKSNEFVKKFVELMPPVSLGLQTREGNTALSFAAMVGNTEAATILVKKDPSLLFIGNNNGSLPIHIAAEYVHRKTLWYLLTATKKNSSAESDPFAGQSGVKLLVKAINSEFFDVALYLVNHYPALARVKPEKGDSPLTAIAGNPAAFLSGADFNVLEIFVYNWFSVKGDGNLEQMRDMEPKDQLTRGTPYSIIYGLLKFHVFHP